MQVGETTLRKALADYRTIYMAYRNFADRTREEYGNDLEDFVKYCERSGTERVGGLGLLIIERYIAQLEAKGYSSMTRKRRVVTIRTFLTFLYQDGYVASNTAAKVVLPFAESPMPHILTQTECDRLRGACAGSVRDMATVEVLLQTGIRLSEVTNLKLNDLDLDEYDKAGERVGHVRISGERSRRERVLPLDSLGVLALKHYLNHRQSVSNVVFLNRFGEPLGARGVQKMLKRCLRRAGIRSASIHTLRHTFGAKQIAEGKSLKALQEAMGHRDRRSTSIYASFANNQEVGR